MVAAILLIAVLFVENFCLDFDCAYMGASIFVFVGISYVLRFLSDIFTDAFTSLFASSFGAFPEAIIISIAINSIFDCKFDKNFGTLFSFVTVFARCLWSLYSFGKKDAKKNEKI